MEPAVNKLETMENPIALLEELAVVKSRYKTLCVQLENISKEQRESMRCIRAALENTMKMVQGLQQHTDLERVPLSGEEQTAAQQLTCQTVNEMESPVEEPVCSESTVSGSTDVSLELQFKPLTEETFMTVPRSIRSTVKLADLNTFYRELFNHFIVNKNRAALSISEMSKMKMKVTDSRIRILKELDIVELDVQGNVKLVV
ncbi:spindle and kinetochore-associated protein 2 isoform X2 [Colius striatus]|uniref:spindle and kinetochore-associated protein 2 isoform X2 n=1 Tax=Colius striatus TaxID=57412 RepID=UPI002B1D6058|nr:spindle and kinetochore-associated protein 2 isoform X2 [Colius striatus]